MADRAEGGKTHKSGSWSIRSDVMIALVGGAA
jgi:hypothetical protein